jgi:integrase
VGPMAKSDTRYLKKRHQRWYFVTAVPRALHGRFVGQGPNGKPGKPLSKIVVTLNTQSLSEAQDRRWPLVNEWRENFRRALSNAPLTRAEIDDEARKLYEETKIRLDNAARRGLPEALQHHEGINNATSALAVLKGVGDFDALLISLAENIWKNIGFEFDPTAPAPSWQKAETVIAQVDDFETAGVAHEVAIVEQRKGLTLDPVSETYRTLGRALIRARLAAVEGRLRALQGQATEEPETFLGREGIDPVTLRPIAPAQRPQIRLRDGHGMKFSEAAARYIDAKRKAGKMTGHTQRQRETVFRLFKNFTKDAPLAAIDKLTATDFLEQIGKLDPKWHNIKGAQDIPLGKLIEKCASRPGRLTNRTINSYIHALSGVFKLADKDGHFDGRNPFAGRTLEEPKGSGWRGYKIEELNNLFGAVLLRDMSAEQRIRPAKYTFENAMAWIPLIALFSGMRSNEICQMRASDVRRKEGVWVFNVSEEGVGQSLKTEAAKRVVPVHSELIRCGFLDYVKALPRDSQLWPALKPGGLDGKYNHYFAKRFTLYRRRCGVTAPGTSFHSFRKNVAQALKDRRATPAEIAELIGHEQGFTLSVYAPMQLPARTLRELIERIKYPGLRLKHFAHQPSV